MNDSVVQEMATNNIGIYISRDERGRSQEILNAIDVFNDFNGTESCNRSITIILECGIHTTIEDYMQLPDHSMPCPCGNKNHWVLLYESDNIYSSAKELASESLMSQV